MTDIPVALPATQALLDLAATTRPDIDRQELQGLIVQATQRRGWAWAMQHTVGMLGRGEDLRDLKAELADPAHTRSRRTHHA